MAALLQRRPRLTMDHRFDDEPGYLELVRPQFPREDGRIDETNEPIPLSRQEGRIEPPVAIRAALPPAVESETQPLSRPRLVENPVSSVPLVRNEQPIPTQASMPATEPLVRSAQPLETLPNGNVPIAPDPNVLNLTRQKEVIADNEGNPVAPYQDKLTRLEGYRDAQAKEPPKKMGFWKRLGFGMLQGLGAPGGDGSIGSMIGKALGGGGINAAMPSLLPNLQKQGQLKQTDSEIAREIGLRKAKADIEMDTARVLELRRKPEEEARKVLAAIAAERRKDDRAWKETYDRQGKAWKRFDDGRPDEPIPDPNNRNQQLVVDEQIIHFIDGVAARGKDVIGAQSTARSNSAKAENEYNQNLNKWQTDATEATAKAKGARAEATALRAQKADLDRRRGAGQSTDAYEDNLRYRELQDKIDTKEAEATQWEEAAKLPKPARPTVAQAPTITSAGQRPQYAGQRMSRAKLPEAAKRLGISEAEAEKQLANDGVILY